MRKVILKLKIRVIEIIFLIIITGAIAVCGRDTSTVENSLIGHWKAHSIIISGTTLAGESSSTDLRPDAKSDLNYYIGKKTVFIINGKNSKSQYDYKITNSNERYFNFESDY